jgi:hypothetical protein
MTRDPMHELGLERDPTLRVSFPAAEEKLDPNCLESGELAGFYERRQNAPSARHRDAGRRAVLGLRLGAVN